MSDQYWRYERAGQQVGPFPLEELQQLAKLGMIQANTVLLHPNGSRIPAAEVLTFDVCGPSSSSLPEPVLAAAAGTDIPPPPPPPPDAQGSGGPVPSSAATPVPIRPRPLPAPEGGVKFLVAVLEFEDKNLYTTLPDEAAIQIDQKTVSLFSTSPPSGQQSDLCKKSQQQLPLQEIVDVNVQGNIVSFSRAKEGDQIVLRTKLRAASQEDALRIAGYLLHLPPTARLSQCMKQNLAVEASMPIFLVALLLVRAIERKHLDHSNPAVWVLFWIVLGIGVLVMIRPVIAAFLRRCPPSP